MRLQQAAVVTSTKMVRNLSKALSNSKEMSFHDQFGFILIKPLFITIEKMCLRATTPTRL